MPLDLRIMELKCGDTFQPLFIKQYSKGQRYWMSKDFFCVGLGQLSGADETVI